MDDVAYVTLRRRRVDGPGWRRSPRGWCWANPTPAIAAAAEAAGASLRFADGRTLGRGCCTPARTPCGATDRPSCWSCAAGCRRLRRSRGRRRHMTGHSGLVGAGLRDDVAAGQGGRHSAGVRGGRHGARPGIGAPGHRRQRPTPRGGVRGGGPWAHGAPGRWTWRPCEVIGGDPRDPPSGSASLAAARTISSLTDHVDQAHATR